MSIDARRETPSIAGWMLVLLFGVLLACGGTAASSSEVRAPDGKPAVAINCKGSEKQCHKEAGRVCDRGYEVLEARKQKRAIDMFVRCRLASH